MSGCHFGLLVFHKEEPETDKPEFLKSFGWFLPEAIKPQKKKAQTPSSPSPRNSIYHLAPHLHSSLLSQPSGASSLKCSPESLLTCPELGLCFPTFPFTVLPFFLPGIPSSPSPHWPHYLCLTKSYPASLCWSYIPPWHIITIFPPPSTLPFLTLSKGLPHLPSPQVPAVVRWRMKCIFK